MAPYLFVIAAIILAVCTMIVFLSSVSQIKADPSSYEKVVQSFFIKIFMIEIIPIALVVYGFYLNHWVADFSELYVPLIILVATMAITAIFILLQVKIDVEEELRGRITTFGLIAIALANSIPIIGIVALFTMI